MHDFVFVPVLIFIFPSLKYSLLGHAVSYPEEASDIRDNFSPNNLVNNVTSKTDDTQHIPDPDDVDLDIKDEENNVLQQEILNSYIASKQKHLKGPKLVSIESPKDGSSICSEAQDVQDGQSVLVNPLKSNSYFEYEMELILFEEKDICTQLTILEHQIRELEQDGGSDQKLLNCWFDLVSRKNLVFHRRLMLEIMQNEQDLEQKCELLQSALRKPDLNPQKEELLLKELLRTVDMRDKLLIERNDEENILCQEELIGKQVNTRLKVQKQKCKIQ